MEVLRRPGQVCVQYGLWALGQVFGYQFQNVRHS